LKVTILANIAIIPARGGSKRILKKNIKLFLGEPIINRVLRQVILSNIFDQVIVSTDDISIMQVVSDSHNIDIHSRSSDLSDDHTGTQAVIQNVCYEMNLNDYDNICCIYPTAALLRAKTLVETLSKFNKSNSDFLFSVKRFEHPIQRGFCINDVNKIISNESARTFERTQDINEVYFDAGYFYWGSGRVWKAQKSIINHSNEVFVYGPLDSWDIDDIEDWTVAEKLASLL